MKKSSSFYWYDLETWGINPKTTRPAQFAGIRTTTDFEIIGDPLVLYSDPTEDLLPDPGSVLITGITPQFAHENGVSERTFAAKIFEEFTTQGTISLGYNTMRFDNEFIRYLFWRNFYEPYVHESRNDCSRWDIVDVVRLTRALRPEGIEWPFDEETGKPTNRLEKLSKANGIEHDSAHDALSDVYATIGMAKMIATKQPKLWDYVFSHRDKFWISNMLDIASMTPVVHSSNKISSDFLGTAVVAPIAKLDSGVVVAWDLRQDPTTLLDMTVDQIKANIFAKKEDLPEGQERLGLKGINPKKSPVITPISVLDSAASDRIKVDMSAVSEYRKKLLSAHDLADKIISVYSGNNYSSTPHEVSYITADEQLYGGSFVSRDDRLVCNDIIDSPDADVPTIKPVFSEQRLSDLWFMYKCRNFPESLSEEDQQRWHQHCKDKLLNSETINFASFEASLNDIYQNPDNSSKLAALNDLKLWAESIYPEID